MCRLVAYPSSVVLVSVRLNLGLVVRRLAPSGPSSAIVTQPGGSRSFVLLASAGEDSADTTIASRLLQGSRHC